MDHFNTHCVPLFYRILVRYERPRCLSVSCARDSPTWMRQIKSRQCSQALTPASVYPPQGTRHLNLSMLVKPL